MFLLDSLQCCRTAFLHAFCALFSACWRSVTSTQVHQHARANSPAGCPREKAMVTYMHPGWSFGPCAARQTFLRVVEALIAHQGRNTICSGAAIGIDLTQARSSVRLRNSTCKLESTKLVPHGSSEGHTALPSWPCRLHCPLRKRRRSKMETKPPAQLYSARNLRGNTAHCSAGDSLLHIERVSASQILRRS